MEITAEEQRNEGKPPDDERESCLMCGACEILGEGCVLHVRAEPGPATDIVETTHDELLKHELDSIDTL